MPNTRKSTKVHIGGWVDKQLEEDLVIVALFRVTDKTNLMVEILKKQLHRELKKIPEKLRAQVLATLRERRKDGKRTAIQPSLSNQGRRGKQPATIPK